MRSSSTSRSKVRFSVGIRELEREVGVQLGEALQLQVDDRLLVAERDFVEGDRVAVAAAAGLGDGVPAGGVAGGAPVVGGELADDAVQLDRPRERVQVVCEAPGVVLLDRPPFALAGDRGRLAGLGDLEAAAGERVQQRRLCRRSARGRARPVVCWAISPWR